MNCREQTGAKVSRKMQSRGLRTHQLWGAPRLRAGPGAPLGSVQVTWTLFAPDLNFPLPEFQVGLRRPKRLIPRSGTRSVYNPVHPQDAFKQLKSFLSPVGEE